MAANALPLEANDVMVKVGGGRKAHVFRPHPAANLKRFELREGGTVYDIAMCGARGALVQAEADAEACGSCTAALERD